MKLKLLLKFISSNKSDLKICLGRPYHFKFFKGCLPQILLGPFLNILPYVWHYISFSKDLETCPKIRTYSLCYFMSGQIGKNCSKRSRQWNLVKIFSDIKVRRSCPVFLEYVSLCERVMNWRTNEKSQVASKPNFLWK